MTTLRRLDDVRRTLRAQADPKRAKDLARFFQTHPGGYGEGDRFLGLKIPQLRALVRKHRDLPLADLDALVKSPWHEERMLGLLVLVERSRRATPHEQDRLARWYLARRRHVDNWDLVDSSAPYLLDGFLGRHGPATLHRLARSRNVWDRRIAMLGTGLHIRRGETRHALVLARMLVHDPHDLIHKAVGWMLREIGTRRPRELYAFLDEHAATMPRTMLRYALEKVPAGRRRHYMTLDRSRRTDPPAGPAG